MCHLFSALQPFKKASAGRKKGGDSFFSMLLLEEPWRASTGRVAGGLYLPFPSPLCLDEKGEHSNRNFQGFPTYDSKIHR